MLHDNLRLASSARQHRVHFSSRPRCLPARKPTATLLTIRPAPCTVHSRIGTCIGTRIGTRGAGIRISMDGRGRCIDDAFVERVWRSLKYELVFLHAYEDGGEARAGIGRYFEFYNLVRPYQALGYQTPDDLYRGVTLTAA